MIADRATVIAATKLAAQRIEPEPDRLLSVREVAEMMSVGGKLKSDSAIWKWIRAGVKVKGTNRVAKLRGTRLPNCVAVRLSDLWQFIDELQLDWQPEVQKTDEEYLAMIGRKDPSAGRSDVRDGARTPAAG